MAFQFESLPNELFISEIFPYLSYLDINYAFFTLNKRFSRLTSVFNNEKVHKIYLTTQIPIDQLAFILYRILPYMTRNQNLVCIELSNAQLFTYLMEKIDHVNTEHLAKLVVTSYVDIDFHKTMKLILSCTNLTEVRLNVLTNIDSSWANGRKWRRCFDLLLKEKRHVALKIIEINVWCINENEIVHFNGEHWNSDGTYRCNPSWRVQLKPDQIRSSSHARLFHLSTEYKTNYKSNNPEKCSPF